MANPLAITLLASEARVASGQGAAVDIGALRTAVRLELWLTAATAGADHVLSVALETSDASGGPWRPAAELGTFGPQAPAKLETSVADLDQFVRATWTIAGTAPSFTFQIAGTAHVLYAEPKHVRRFGIQPGALEGVEDSELAEYCIVASTEADGYLAKGHTLPFSAWDDDLRQHCAKIVVYRYLNAKGRQPTGPEDIVDKDFAGAIRWLTGVGKGVINPPGLVDSTPETAEFGYCVETAESRGWDEGPL